MALFRHVQWQRGQRGRLRGLAAGAGLQMMVFYGILLAAPLPAVRVFGYSPGAGALLLLLPLAMVASGSTFRSLPTESTWRLSRRFIPHSAGCVRSSVGGLGVVAVSQTALGRRPVKAS